MALPAATGGGLATRQLYSDLSETIINVQRPIILNGIAELATRGDLLDRSIVISLPTLDPEKRREMRPNSAPNSSLLNQNSLVPC